MHHEHVPRTCTDPLVRRKQWRRDIKFGTWNVRSGLFIAVARELDLLLIQEVRWDKGGNGKDRGL